MQKGGLTYMYMPTALIDTKMHSKCSVSQKNFAVLICNIQASKKPQRARNLSLMNAKHSHLNVQKLKCMLKPFLLQHG